ncbi:GAF domain-containing protein [Candidatus Nomurabacteria bacterium]|nr:GAF domain-containing protein [Candidatus Nomurabacteria bacterium]
MQPAPIPKNEKKRLISLHKLGLLDTKPEERFDRITRTATKIFNAPISTLALVDSKREWFKSVCGIDQKEGDRAVSFCGHALLANEIFVIPDTTRDKRFSDNPMVIGKPYIRFYAGVPIINADGERIGVFCVKDIKSRKFSKDNEEMLENLATWAELEINSRNLSLALSEERKMRARLETQTLELENAKIAASNVLEDLSIEKSKVEIARAKEEAILLSIGDGIIATDEKGNITLINKVAEKLLDIKSEKVIGKVFSEVLLLTDEKGVPILLDKRPTSMALATTTTTTTGPSYYYERKDKIRFPVAIKVTPIILDKKIIGTVEIFRDITQERESDKAKSEFVSLASHQLKTPPTAIKLLTERILSGKTGELTEKQKGYLNDVYSETQHSIEIVNALLSVSRIEMGPFAIQLSKKDICEVVQNVLHELKPAIDRKHLRLKEMHLKKKIIVPIDETLLTIALNNLITNAINYTAGGGAICVECKEIRKGETFGEKLLAENSFVVAVADTGYGIPKSQQNKLFAKFFRADNAREKQPAGTGLGLYIVKSILNNSGGSVWFTSEENKGTTFYVAIPMTGMKAKVGKKELVDI